MFVGLPALYGSWLMVVYGGYAARRAGRERAGSPAQLPHGLHEPDQPLSVLEHDYHLEHHMFPMVPYYNLAELHELIKADLPPATMGCLGVARDHSRPCARQWKDPAYFVQRRCPRRRRSRAPAPPSFHCHARPSMGWVEVCDQPAARETYRASTMAAQHLRHLPHRRRPPLRHRRLLHPRNAPSGRRLPRAPASSAPSTTAASTSATVRCSPARANRCAPTRHTSGTARCC